MTGMFPPEASRHRASTALPLLPGRWIAGALLLSLLTVGLLLRIADLDVAASPALAGFAAWAAAAGAFCYALRAPATRIQRAGRDFVEGVSLFALVSLLGAVASYPLATGNHPFVDTELERLDLRLHFHWVGWYEWVAHHSWCQWIERPAYLSIFVTPASLIGYFAWTGRKAECRLFLATFWIAVVTTLALFPFFPAAGPFATLWHGSAPYMPISALYQNQVILALRDHLIRSIDLGTLHGLVCAPSFHAASATIYLVTAARVRLLRWPLIAINVVMLLATPVEGTHYLTDIMAGALIGGLALWITPGLIARIRARAMGWRRDPATLLAAAE